MSTEKDNADQNSAKKLALRALQIASGAQQNQVQEAKGANVHNTAAVVAAGSITTPTDAEFRAAAPGVVASTTPRVRLSGGGFFRHSIVDTAMTIQYVRDPNGANVTIGPVLSFDSSHVNANGCATLPEYYDTPGAGVRVYALRVATAAGTVSVLAANEVGLAATPVQ